ncbi:MAG: A24 family peptidase, partial [Desulfuromonadales bacterium]
MAKRIAQIPRYTIGLAAAGACAWVAWTGWGDPAIFLASAFLLLICATDTIRSRIPNLLTVSLLLAGVGWNLYQSGWEGLLISGLGFLTGMALLMLFYALGGMAAGDVKAMGALGAVLGPAAVFHVFLYTGLIGGVLGLLFSALSAEQRKKTNDQFDRFKVFLLTKDTSFMKPEPPTVGKETFRLQFPYAT